MIDNLYNKLNICNKKKENKDEGRGKDKQNNKNNEIVKEKKDF